MTRLEELRIQQSRINELMSSIQTDIASAKNRVNEAEAAFIAAGRPQDASHSAKVEHMAALAEYDGAHMRHNDVLRRIHDVRGAIMVEESNTFGAVGGDGDGSGHTLAKVEAAPDVEEVAARDQKRREEAEKAKVAANPPPPLPGQTDQTQSQGDESGEGNGEEAGASTAGNGSKKKKEKK